MDLRDLRKKVAANLRSVTQSCKGGVPFESLERDYRDLLGVSIPYETLGYLSLEAMLKAMPDVVTLNRSAGKCVVMAVADETTAHIASLVARQRSATKKPRSRRTLKVRRAPASQKTSVRQFNKGTRAPPSHLQSNLQAHSQSASAEFQEPAKSISHRTSETVIHTTKPKAAPSSTFGPKYEVPPRFLRKQERPLTSLENNSTDDRLSTVTTTTFKEANIERTVTYATPDSFVPPPMYRPERTTYKHPTSMVEVIERYAKVRGLTACFRTIPVSKSKYTATLIMGDRTFWSETFVDDESASRENCADCAVRQLKLKGSAREFVDQYVRRNNLKCEYRTSTIGQKKTSFLSVLTIKDEKYRNYPNATATPEQAEEAVAELAKQAIIQREGLPTIETNINDSHGLELMLSRIDQIVAQKPKGIWSDKLPGVYEEMFGEKLPEVWFPLAETHCSYYYTRYGNRVIMYPTATSGRTSPSSNTSNQEDENAFDDLERRLSVHVPVLDLPPTNDFDVFISNVQDVTCVAVRLLDYADAFNALSEKMKAFYEKNRCPVSNVSYDRPYAVYLYELWHRALVEETKGDMVVCQLVDEGDIVEVGLDCLQELDPSFLDLSFQIVTFKLADLDAYSSYIDLEMLKYYLLGKLLVAHVVDSNRDSIILYDTSTEEDVNVNRVIFEKTVEASLKYTLPESGSSHVGYISHVSPCGTIYLTFNSKSVTNLLEDELCRITPICVENAKNAKRDKFALSKSVVYCARYDTDTTWYRAVVLETDYQKGEVEVLYVDYGNTSWVPLSCICELQPVSTYLAELPFQALRCKLSELPPRNRYWSEEAVLKLIELAPFDRGLIVRVEKPDPELPEVALFVRNEQSQIVSINQTLAYDEHLFSPVPSGKRDRLPSWTKEAFSEFNKKEYKPQSSSSARSDISPPAAVETVTSPQENLSNFIPDVAVSAEQQLAKRHGNRSLSVPSNGNECDNEGEEFPPLYPPDIPDKGNYFDIFVTMAASPFNFMCQPLNSSKDLDQLFSEMQSFYSNEENLCEMHSVLVKQGEFFAGKHSDGSWYRVRKQSIVSEDPLQVSVYFVDYGDMCILPLPNLQPLFKQFKSLPCQCMKASLNGVRPNGHDWDPLECYEFKKMVEEKQFVSVIESKKLKVEDHLTVYSLELVLIDVSDPKIDISIHEQLIKNEIAQPAK